jgi:N-acetylneuraminate synthase
MTLLHERFGLPVGYSDHTEGVTVAIAAVALGAQVIEKHLTLDRTLPGPDHAASLEPDEMAALVRSVRTAETALGDASKGPDPSELDVRSIARRGLYAARDLDPSEPLGLDDLLALRPGDATMPPSALWDWLGRRPDRTYRAGEPFEG